jgi:hypothetical protein
MAYIYFAKHPTPEWLSGFTAAPPHTKAIGLITNSITIACKVMVSTVNNFMIKITAYLW